ncbi:PspC domain-containing protein [Methylibium rhizosphaerae]|jgi:phage shock protein C|uniref:PspC domain-containing protein n=1 Tax=Methylibium rhizosphaerae TaxID=2570323 RepID=UPI001127BA14|nr:PspC domain-containing protein [Methylibium rhizosphaerae]
MSLPDELAKLEELHQRGALSDDEYARAKARVLAGEPAPRSTPSAVSAVNGLVRSRDDRWLGGVCGGLAATTGVASWIWRLLFVLAVFCAGASVVAYLLLWIFVPEAPPVPSAGVRQEEAHQ